MSKHEFTFTPTYQIILRFQQQAYSLILCIRSGVMKNIKMSSNVSFIDIWVAEFNLKIDICWQFERGGFATLVTF